MRTVRRTRHKVDWLTFLFCEEAVVRTKPSTILGICAWVVREAAQANVSTNRRQVAPRRMNDIENFLRGDPLEDHTRADNGDNNKYVPDRMRASRAVP
jgi:hypothetical protein